MRVLALAGTGALTLTLPLAGLIIVMLAIVTISYRQTIKAYPMGASSYIVASDNLGDRGSASSPHRPCSSATSSRSPSRCRPAWRR